MMKKYFGTDGIRGGVGIHPITPEFMLDLGWAIGKSVREVGGTKNLILIGKDTRRSGYMFESALQAGMMAAGVAPGLLGPMPTPAISYLTRTMHARAGIVISASHNSHTDNGIKIFDSNGRKLADDKELEIESYLEGNIESVSSKEMLKAFRISNADGRYIEYCKGTVDSDFWMDGMKVVLDCANGATYKIAPEIFSELGANIVVINHDPDGLNINEGCGSTMPSALQAKVLSESADLGVAFDGDGDRVVLVDSKGGLIEGDHIIFIISEFLRAKKKLRGVVGTHMTNYALENYYRDHKVPFFRADVGDRFVIKEMLAKKYNLGGEPSGHIICGDVSTTGDGIVAALQAIQSLNYFGEPLHIAKQVVAPLPQFLENIAIAKAVKKVNKDKVLQQIEKAKQNLKGKGRILVRPSGTESLIRVMVESYDVSLGHKEAQLVAKTIRENYPS